MEYITVHTKLIGLLGTPLAQSISYRLQNDVYRRMGLDCFYLPIEVARKEDLPYVVEGIRRMNFSGFAVTKPYKETILPLLDQLDESARRVGACNTVVVTDGRLVGYNTDGTGFLRSLESQLKGGPAGKRFLSFGAGGAARAVCFELAAHGAAHIHIVSVTGSGARLAQELNAQFPGMADPILAADRKGVAAAAAQAQVLLNLSGLGMAPHLDESPLEPQCFSPAQFCWDAVYQPEETLFLRQARQAGCPTLNGLGMVVYQGLEQIRLWTGAQVPAQWMFDAVQG